VTGHLMSVVIPTRDRRVFVRRAIEYFERRQPFVDAELIIVDGGKWPLSENDIHGHKCIRAPEDCTVGVQLNLGIEAAKGYIILRQDDDDWYAPDWYDASLKTVTGSKSGIAGITDFYAYNMVTRRAGRWLAWGQKPEESHWSGGTMSFRRDTWERCPFNRDKIGSDREFLLDAYKFDPTPRSIVPDGTTKHVMIRHGRNMTGKCTHLGPDESHTVRKILGKDLEWYEDIADVVVPNVNMKKFPSIRRGVHLRHMFS
jgi:glycosyltransferase involved in cell wall biosynthesis